MPKQIRIFAWKETMEITEIHKIKKYSSLVVYRIKTKLKRKNNERKTRNIMGTNSKVINFAQTEFLKLDRTDALPVLNHSQSLRGHLAATKLHHSRYNPQINKQKSVSGMKKKTTMMKSTSRKYNLQNAE